MLVINRDLNEEVVIDGRVVLRVAAVRPGRVEIDVTELASPIKSRQDTKDRPDGDA